MKIKAKLLLTITTIGILSPAVILAHPGHVSAESNIFHYIVDHASSHYVWVLSLVLLLVLIGFSTKR
ncbi:MAG: hypothetical protein AAF304_05485 [Pseudomonadota bacterium]